MFARRRALRCLKHRAELHDLDNLEVVTSELLRLGSGALESRPESARTTGLTPHQCSTLNPDPTYGTKGKTTCTSSSCLSDWANVFDITYQFIGFGSPVSNTELNGAKAGQAIPIKFQVLDASNKPVLNLTAPPVTIVSVPLSCNTSEPSTDMTTASATGNSGFQNLGGGNYQFNWSTSKSWAGTCRQIQVSLGSGNLHTANFKFK